MNTHTLYRLGAAALLLWTVLLAIGNVTFLLAPDAPVSTTDAWRTVFGEAFLLLGLFALFAFQAERGGWLAVAGFVLLVFSSLYGVGSASVSLAVAEGAATSEQVSAAPSIALANQVFPWTYYAGAVLFGIALYRGGAVPKHAGALLALLGILAFATGPLSSAIPIVILVSAITPVAVITWAWLGLALWGGRPAPLPRPNTQPA